MFSSLFSLNNCEKGRAFQWRLLGSKSQSSTLSIRDPSLEKSEGDAECDKQASYQLSKPLNEFP